MWFEIILIMFGVVIVVCLRTLYIIRMEWKAIDPIFDHPDWESMSDEYLNSTMTDVLLKAIDIRVWTFDQVNPGLRKRLEE